MSLEFRNLQVSPDSPAGDWPTEAVQTALERGDFTHWQRLAAQIARRPWGRTARQVEETLSHSRPFGVAELMEAVISRARSRAEVHERSVVAAEVRGCLEGSGLSRAAFASSIGTSTSRLSTYVTGKVVPSAALMVRMRGLGDRAADESVGSARGGSVGDALLHEGE